MSAFERARYWPYDPNRVLEPLRAKLIDSQRPKLPSFLPREDELVLAKEHAQYLYTRHINVTNPLLLSPSRHALEGVCETTDKAIVLKRANDQHLRKVRDRKDAFSKKTSRRFYKPDGWQYDSLSAAELRERQATERAAEEEKNRNSQLRAFRAAERAKEKALRDEWRPYKSKYPFIKDWLKEVKGIDDFIPCGKSHPLWSGGNQRKKPTFYIDKTATPLPPWLKYVDKPLTYLREPPEHLHFEDINEDNDDSDIDIRLTPTRELSMESEAEALSDIEGLRDKPELPSSPPVRRLSRRP
ncbi:hypothetical protein F4861DRAFT_544556 [Xylaria intraflava]|nr:hypothetical protein F4861DRAFT_544556 [Xylaria intraflava]